jgi:hypothetical protein
VTNQYLHVDVLTSTTPRHPGDPIGDVVQVARDRASTSVVLADGLGHGVAARVAATLYAAQVLELLRHEFSTREAFLRVAHDIHARRGASGLYAALIVARIRPNGETTILTYDAPPALFVGRQAASVLTGRNLENEPAFVREAHCFLEAGEGLLLVSDGVTQAGLGTGLAEGLTIEGVARLVTDARSSRTPLDGIARLVHRKARDLWGRVQRDDVTASILAVRVGQPLVLLTGPPVNRDADPAVVQAFLAAQGRKVICGASTAQMVARILGKRLKVRQDHRTPFSPPCYFLESIDLVTEGVVTLNQVLNLLGTDPARYEPDDSVSTLAAWLKAADRITFQVGRAANLGGRDIAFVQQGIQPRGTVVPLLVRALEEQGKLVTCDWF